MTTQLQLQDNISLAQALHERNALASAIRSAAIKAGIVNESASLSGPMLIMLADDLATCAVNARAEEADLAKSETPYDAHPEELG